VTGAGMSFWSSSLRPAPVLRANTILDVPRVHISDPAYVEVTRLSGPTRDRQEAIELLASQRDQSPHLSTYLWNTPGAMSALLGEILSVFPLLPSSAYGLDMARRILSVLHLLQSLARDNETQIPFIRANFPLFLFPLLQIGAESRPFELSVLGVFASLISSDRIEIIDYIIKIDFLPVLLNSVKAGQGVVRILSMFILNKLLAFESARTVVFESRERILRVLNVLNLVVLDLIKAPNPKTENFLIGCYAWFLSPVEIVQLVVESANELNLSFAIHEQNSAAFSEFLDRLRNVCL
jgi:CCR4-NOT transcription complex subunit 9